MKTKNLIQIAAASVLFTAVGTAQETTRTDTTVEANPDGSVTETTRTVTFTPEVREKVVTYFEPYTKERYGLPSEVATQIKMEQIPAVWRTGTLSPGLVIEKEHRPMLVPAPEKLVSVFSSKADPGRKYYIAGGNVVAIDDEYRVVESVRIPTIKFDVSE